MPRKTLQLQFPSAGVVRRGGLRAASDRRAASFPAVSWFLCLVGAFLTRSGQRTHRTIASHRQKMEESGEIPPRIDESTYAIQPSLHEVDTYAISPAPENALAEAPGRGEPRCRRLIDFAVMNRGSCKKGAKLLCTLFPPATLGSRFLRRRGRSRFLLYWQVSGVGSAPRRSWVNLLWLPFWQLGSIERRRRRDPAIREYF